LIVLHDDAGVARSHRIFVGHVDAFEPASDIYAARTEVSGIIWFTAPIVIDARTKPGFRMS
jgi:hypothetical protein